MRKLEDMVTEGMWDHIAKNLTDFVSFWQLLLLALTLNMLFSGTWVTSLDFWYEFCGPACLRNCTSLFSCFNFWSLQATFSDYIFKLLSLQWEGKITVSKDDKALDEMTRRSSKSIAVDISGRTLSLICSKEHMYVSPSIGVRCLFITVKSLF